MFFQLVVLGMKTQDGLTAEMLVEDPSQQQVAVTQPDPLVAGAQLQAA